MTAYEDSRKAAALKLLSSGEATLSEVASLCGESKQRVDYWARQAGLNPPRAREIRLARIWGMHMKRLESA